MREVCCLKGLTTVRLRYDLLRCLLSFVGADRIFTQPTGTFTSGLPTVWSPAPPPDITTVPTGKFAPAGLSPARSTTSFTALTGPICARPGNLQTLQRLNAKRAS